MRIAAIFDRNPEPKTTSRHGWRLLRKLAPLCDGYWQITADELIRRGPDSAVTMLMDEYKVDAVVMYGAIRLLVPYLKPLRCAKVAIATDSCYMFPNKELMDRYVDCGFDLMLQRGTYDPDLTYSTPQAWWPFSADPEEFYPGGPRLNKIGFAGSLGNTVYNQRIVAAQMLIDKEMLSLCIHCRKGFDFRDIYPQFLRDHVAGLTSTQMNGISSNHTEYSEPMDMPSTPRAKTFEMMASATAVLTPPFFMQENLFSDAGKVCFWYNQDHSDVLQVARGILEDTDRTREVALAGYDHFLHHHTDEIRLRELYDHIGRLVEGKAIERKWGI